MDEEKLVKEWQWGEQARAVEPYLKEFISSQRNMSMNKILQSQTLEELLEVKARLKLMDELEKGLNRDIKAGEIALKKMKEES